MCQVQSNLFWTRARRLSPPISGTKSGFWSFINIYVPGALVKSLVNFSPTDLWTRWEFTFSGDTRTARLPLYDWMHRLVWYHNTPRWRSTCIIASWDPPPASSDSVW